MADEARRAAPEPTKLERAKKAYSVVGDIFTPTRIILLLTLAALGIAGLFGGWDRVTAAKDDKAVIPVGEPVAADPFELTVTRIRHADELKPIVYEHDEYRYLLVVAEVLNTSDAPVDVTLLQRSITLHAEGLPTISRGVPIRPEIYRTLDSLSARVFQPGVATPSVLVWRQAKTEPIPAELSITFNPFIWRYSIIEESDGWFDPEPAATMTLPVQAVGS